MAVCAGALSLRAEANSLLPQPAKLSPGQGRLAITGTFRVALTGYVEPRLRAAAQRVVQRLAMQTGIPLKEGIERDRLKAALVIHCERAGERVQTIKEDESYRLDVSAQQAHLTAPTPVGVLRGMETFLQLVDLDTQGFGVAAVEIDDHPRFPWRGLLIDASRHWMPVPVIKRNLDAMGAVKLDVLHWHLSDDQGFRVESKKFPKLQGMGSDGLYYTQEDVRDVLNYARERGIRVVPEFDMPGHTTSWFVGYPELAGARGPYAIERSWGIFDPAMDPTKEGLYTFLDVFIGEMAALFPDEYFHIGGDEVNGKQWDRSPRIQAFMRKHGMKANHDLQAYFNRRVLAIVQRHGKKMVGWDEILHPELPKNIVVHSWRGQKSLAEAARQGYRGILSYGYYLDHIQTASFHYNIDPMEGETAALTEEQKSRILGGEACMWAEYVTTENIDSRIWPRAAAIAERFWSPQEVKDVESMYRRLEATSRYLEGLGLTHRSSYQPMLERLTGTNDAAPLKVLANLLEPVKFYQRGETRPYTSFTPLNRLVDTTRPESDVARQFAGLVENLGANKEKIRKQLALWRDNQAELIPVMQRSALLQEAIPLAEDVSALATAGLEALEYIEAGKPAPQPWVDAQIALLGRAAKPRAELLIMIVPSIRKLVETAQAGK
ncbi:MAG: family 20 glycosylhydrolase [Terriglobia bacterium]